MIPKPQPHPLLADRMIREDDLDALMELYVVNRRDVCSIDLKVCMIWGGKEK